MFQKCFIELGIRGYSISMTTHYFEMSQGLAGQTFQGQKDRPKPPKE